MITALLLLACSSPSVTIDWSPDPAQPPPADTGEPGATDPGTTAPGTVDPGTTDPGTTDPDTEAPADTAVTGTEELPEVDSGLGFPPHASDALYDREAVHQLTIRLSAEAITDLNRNGREYTEGQLFEGDTDYGAVGVRLKGGSTYNSLSGKPSFKLKFDWGDADGTEEQWRFYSSKRVNLHSLIYEPSAVAEDLAYTFFRQADIPAPRVGYARVFVNDIDYGLYTVVEPPDDDFLERWFESDDGNLYEGVRCDLDQCNCFDIEEFDEGNHDALYAYCSAAQTIGPDWLDAIQEHMDLERIVNFVAVEAAIAHWDSYSYNLNNYRFYHDPAAERWTMLPWSTDLAFGHSVSTQPGCSYGTDVDGYDWGLLSSRCWSDATCKDALLDALELTADRIEAFDQDAWVTEAQDRLRDEVATDPKIRWDLSDFEEQGECIRAFLAGRPSYLRLWVEQHR